MHISTSQVFITPIRDKKAYGTMTATELARLVQDNGADDTCSLFLTHWRMKHPRGSSS